MKKDDGRYVSEENIKIMRKMYKENHTIGYIAKTCGVSRAGVKSNIKDIKRDET